MQLSKPKIRRVVIAVQEFNEQGEYQESKNMTVYDATAEETLKLIVKAIKQVEE